MAEPEGAGTEVAAPRRRRWPLLIGGTIALALLIMAALITGDRGVGPLAGRVHLHLPFLSASRPPAPTPPPLSYDPDTGLPLDPGAGLPGTAPGAAGLRPGQVRGPSATGGPSSRGTTGAPAPTPIVQDVPVRPGPCVPEVRTDRTSYAVGDTVTMVVIITNTTSSACNVPTGPGGPAFTVVDVNGRQIWGGCDSPTGVSSPCPNQVSQQPLAPNGVFTSTQTWEQKHSATPPANPTQVSPGTYRVRYGQPGYSNTVTIQIR